MKNINGVDYNQLCVMEGTLMPEGGAKELVEFFKNEMGVNVRFETQVKTLPDEPGCTLTGGRNDLFFYIADKDISNNELIVVQGHMHPALYHKKLIASNVHWISGTDPTKIELKAKIRYRGKEKTCNIKKLDNDMVLVSFKEPRFAISPGQSVVFYQNNICLGGALIEYPQN